MLVAQALRVKHQITTLSRKSDSIIHSLFKDINVVRNCMEADIVVFMHPFLYQKYRLVIPKSVKLIVWAHGIEVWGNWGRAKNPNLSLCDKIIAVSNYTKNRIKENWPKADVEVVYNSIDINKKISEEIQFSEKKDMIIVSRMSSKEQYKGHEIVFKSLSLLNKFDSKISPILHIVGDGDDRVRLERVAKSLNVFNQCIFHGFLNDHEISSVYSKSRLFVMPSYVRKSNKKIWGGEGFGLVYLEAGANKIPSIACDEGGQVECIIDGKTGFLVRPNEIEVADKIQLLINNSDLSQKMGLAAYENVVQNFSFIQFQKNVLSLVDRLLN